MIKKRIPFHLFFAMRRGYSEKVRASILKTVKVHFSIMISFQFLFKISWNYSATSFQTFISVKLLLLRHSSSLLQSTFYSCSFFYSSFLYFSAVSMLLQSFFQYVVRHFPYFFHLFLLMKLLDRTYDLSYILDTWSEC